MAHDGSDGSQYDIKGPWDQDYLFMRVEEALAAVEAATTEDEKVVLREVVEDYKYDLYTLHGIKL